jgi:hypothetical protein
MESDMAAKCSWGIYTGFSEDLFSASSNRWRRFFQFCANFVVKALDIGSWKYQGHKLTISPKRNASLILTNLNTGFPSCREQ